MDYFDAWRVHNDYHHTSEVSDEEYLEALEWLSKGEGIDNQVGLFNSAAYYFNIQEYRLALKYFTISAVGGDNNAYFYIGYIYYYGLTGETDYKKAWNCFMRMARWYTLSTIMIAVMYRDGNYVEKDYRQYKAIIEEMYQEPGRDSMSAPHLYFHMAEIRRNEGRVTEAVDFYKIAKEKLANIIFGNPYIGLLRRMEEIVTRLYMFSDIDIRKVDFFDLFYVLAKPCMVHFVYDNKEYAIESHVEGTGISVEFEGHWYRSVLQFIMKAELDGQRLLTLRREIKTIRCQEDLHNE